MSKALIVIDVQKYFLNEETKPYVERIWKYLSKKSNQYQQIYFTIFKNDPSGPLWTVSEWQDCTDSPDIDLCDELEEYMVDDNVFYKNFLSALKVPEIRTGLEENDISEVHLCGFDTDCCVLATTYDLFDENIKPVILEDLTFSTSKDKLHDPAIKMIRRNVGFVQNSE